MTEPHSLPQTMKLLRAYLDAKRKFEIHKEHRLREQLESWVKEWERTNHSGPTK